MNNIVINECDTSHVTRFIISASSCLFGDDTNTHYSAGMKINDQNQAYYKPYYYYYIIIIILLL